MAPLCRASKNKTCCRCTLFLTQVPRPRESSNLTFAVGVTLVTFLSCQRPHRNYFKAVLQDPFAFDQQALTFKNQCKFPNLSGLAQRSSVCSFHLFPAHLVIRKQSPFSGKPDIPDTLKIILQKQCYLTFNEKLWINVLECD